MFGYERRKLLQIGSGTSVSPLAEISESIRGTNITIGSNCMIDSFVRIKPVGGTGDISIGDFCYINSGTVIFSGNGVTIGSKVLIAPNCSIMPVNHNFSSQAESMLGQGFMESLGGITIGNDVWVGAGTTILDGSQIGDGCVISAGSVVRGLLKDFGIYTGNPLMLIGFRNN